jgi:tetratricopeptide (TPR) repeat protein
MRSPRIGQAAVVALGALLLALASRPLPANPSTPAVKRPHYIFINETDNHEHDLAFKMSLKLAEQRAGVENALILLKHLPPNSTIEQFAVDSFRRWQIGRDRSGRGILYVYSERENLFKIEVAYALEGLFPDAVCRQLEEAAQTYVLSSDIPQDFISELLITMNLRAKDPSLAEPPGSWRSPAWLKNVYLSGGAGVRARGYRRTLEDYEAAVRRMPEADIAEFQPSASPEETVARYLRSIERGLGDPRLPLLTEGSRFFRMIVPRNEAQQIRVARYYAQAEPWQLIRGEPLALVVFRQGVANLPIVLRHGGGLWYVDEPKAWTYFHRFENTIDFYPKYDNLPFLAELVRMGYTNAYAPVFARRVDVPPARPYPFSLKAAVAELEKAIADHPTDDRLYASLGELYLFEMSWVSRSLEMFERASRLSPENQQYRWRLFDLYGNDSQAEKMVATLKWLSQRLPGDPWVQNWYRFQNATYHFKRGEFFP